MASVSPGHWPEHWTGHCTRQIYHRLDERSRGILFVCIGITLVLYTGFRYFQVGNALRSGRFTVNVAGVSVILSLFLLVGFACLFFIIHQYLDPKDGR